MITRYLVSSLTVPYVFSIAIFELNSFLASSRFQSGVRGENSPQTHFGACYRQTIGASVIIRCLTILQ